MYCIGNISYLKCMWFSECFHGRQLDPFIVAIEKHSHFLQHWHSRLRRHHYFHQQQQHLTRQQTLRWYSILRACTRGQCVSVGGVLVEPVISGSCSAIRTSSLTSASPNPCSDSTDGFCSDDDDDVLLLLVTSMQQQHVGIIHLL